MKMNDYTIRLEKAEEERDVENLVRESFWNVYRPGCLEHYVLHCLRKDSAFIPELDFVMTVKEDCNELLIGQIVCMKAEIVSDKGKFLPIMTFGPISIHPDYQRKGYGKALLDFAMDKAAKMNVGAVCMEGNIGFYGKCGFIYASRYGIRYYGAPKSEDTPFFLCKELTPGYLAGVTGEYVTPKGYFVDEAECEKFDKQFPAKEKKRLPGQLW